MSMASRKEIESNIVKIEKELEDVHNRADELGNFKGSYLMISENLKELNRERRRLNEKLGEERKKLEDLLHSISLANFSEKGGMGVSEYKKTLRYYESGEWITDLFKKGQPNHASILEAFEKTREAVLTTRDQAKAEIESTKSSIREQARTGVIPEHDTENYSVSLRKKIDFEDPQHVLDVAGVVLPEWLSVKINKKKMPEELLHTVLEQCNEIETCTAVVKVKMSVDDGGYEIG